MKKLLEEMSQKLNQYLEHRRDCELHKPNGVKCTCGFIETVNDFKNRINNLLKHDKNI